MAMYTKMTATGSSLIVAPRSISRDLESRISQSIANIMSKHDISKLTTKFVRQTVEKDVHVSLNNHKEVLKRLMHQELRKIRAQKVFRLFLLFFLQVMKNHTVVGSQTSGSCSVASVTTSSKCQNRFELYIQNTVK